MARPFTAWTVLRHGPLERLAENLWCVEGDIPDVPVKRKMVVARMGDGRLILHSPMALDDERMKQLDALGEIAWLVATNGWHRLDIAPWKARAPHAKLACPEGARKRVSQCAPVDASYEDGVGDDVARIEHLDGMKKGEGVLRVKSADGTTLVFNDVITNMSHFAGTFGFFYKLVGGSGGPRIHGLIKKLLVKDKRALRTHLERLADDDVRRVVPAHGAIMDRDAGALLRRIAGTL